VRAAWVRAVGCFAALVACGDVLHSTDDIQTACEIDAGQPGCGSSFVDFCAWSRPEAERQAARACVWLGACESPMGGNAFGACVFQALMAYDCAANPNHRPKGAAAQGWSCLAGVASCADVDRCVQPQPTAPLACGAADAAPGATSACGSGANAGVRLACTGPATPGAAEPCALWGKTCIATDGGAACTGGGGGLACANGSGPQACAGTAIHACGADGGDPGVDCAGTGAQACGGFPTASAPLWLACLPESDGGACAPSPNITCDDGGVAHACPTGASETLDCDALLGSPEACNAGGVDPAFDWSRACAIDLPCPDDTCAGGSVNSCARGRTFAGDCAMAGLGPCRLVAGDDGAIRAACTPP
jgi:hypothetical protein